MKRPALLLTICLWLSSVLAAFVIGRNLTTKVAENDPQTHTSVSLSVNRFDHTANQAEADETVAGRAISESMLSGANEETLSFTLKNIGYLTPDQVRDFIATAFAMPKSDPNRAKVMGALLTQLAATSPLEALELADQIGSLRDSERAMNSILEIWASKDPTAALKWAQIALIDAPSNLRNSQMRAIIRGYAETNPVAAFQYANAVEATTAGEKQQKYRLLSEVIETQVRNGGLNEARTTIEMLPEDSGKDALMRELVDEWASFDPESAAAYVSSLGPDTPSSLKTALIGEWAENDPVAAAKWLSALPADDPAIGRATAEIIREWTRYDLTASAEWLNSLPESPDLDRAVASYTYRAAAEDPATAMSWAESITNDNMRTHLMQRVAATWKAADNASFETYLNDSDLDEPQKKLLQDAKARGGRGRPPRNN